MESRGTRNLRSGRAAARVLACLAVVPIGLGPSVIASAQVVPGDPVATTAPPATAPPATAPAPVAPVPTTSPGTLAPSATAPPSIAATAPPSIATTAATGTTATTATGTTTASTVADPVTGTTIAVPSTSASTSSVPFSVDPVASTGDPDDSTGPVPSGVGDPSTSPPPASSEPAEPTTTVDAESDATAEGFVPANVVAIPFPASTEWNLSLRVTDGWTYTGPFYLNLRARFGGSRVSVQDGMPPAVLSRPTRGAGSIAYPVRVDMGSSYDPAFPFRWECTGDVSGLSTGTTEQFTPNVDPYDTTMNCVFVVDNSDPPNVTVRTVVEGDPGGLVSFDTTVSLGPFFGNHVVGTTPSASGTSATFDGVAGIPFTITSVATGSTPAETRSDTQCFLGGAYIGGHGLSAAVSGSNLSSGARVTCVITHTIPATLTIVEDVRPDDPSIPAGSYAKSPSSGLSGPNSWTLTDGTASEVMEFSGASPAVASVRRDETPGWDTTGVECIESGSGASYPDFALSLHSSVAVLEITRPPAGTDLVCAFVVAPAGPASLSLTLSTNVFDRSSLEDFQVALTDPSDVALAPLTFNPSGGTQTVVLPEAPGAFTLRLSDDQGRDLAWDCDGVVSSSDSVSFSPFLGETTSCVLEVSDLFPAGVGTITIRQDEVPEPTFASYRVSVSLGDYTVASRQITDGGPDLVITGVAPGSYTVTEIGADPNVELVSVVCTNGTPSAIARTVYVDPFGESSTSTGTFTVDAGVDTVCTLVNARTAPSAIVRVETASRPNGSVDVFGYAIEAPASVTLGTAAFTQVAGRSTTRGVDAGAISIEQQAVAGYTTQWGCAPTGQPIGLADGLSAAVTVADGDDVTCRFVNTTTAAPTANLRVVTSIRPDDFGFIGYAITPAAGIVGGDPATFAQESGSTTSRVTTVGDEVTVAQVSPSGYDTSSTCTGGGAVVAAGDEAVTYTPGAFDEIVCTFVHVPYPTITIVEAVEPDGIPGTDSLYESTTPGAIFAGPVGFGLADDERQLITLRSDVDYSIERSLPVERSSGGPARCGVSGVGVTGAIYTPLASSVNGLTVNAQPGQHIVCTFTTVPPPVAVEVGIDVIVDTGAVDLSGPYEFQIDVSGPGVSGPGGLGVTESLLLGNYDGANVVVLTGSDVTIGVSDVKVGVDGFRAVIDCYSAAAPVTNASVTFTVQPAQSCTVTLRARTVTVLKTVDDPTPGASFGFVVDPAIGDGRFRLESFESLTVVVPLGQSIDVTEVDTAGHEVMIECTEDTLDGPIIPYIGPTAFSNSIRLTDPDLNTYCEVFNFAPGPIVHEVIVNSTVDLGGIPVPPDLRGFFVDFDGDIEGGEVARFQRDPRPGYSSGGLVGSSALSDSVYIAANGSISVFVADLGDLNIAAGAGADRFANTFDCGSGTVAPDGSISLESVTGPITCDLVSAAGVLEVVHRVEGVTTVADWPFTITEVVAGAESVSLADDGSALSAVAASRSVIVTMTDVRGATSVTSSCAEPTLIHTFTGPGASAPVDRFVAPSVLGSSVSVTVPGGVRWRCTFSSTYTSTGPATTAPTTAPPTTVSPTSPTTAPPTTVSPASPTTTTPPPTTTTLGTTPSVIPFAPAPTSPPTQSPTPGPQPSGSTEPPESLTEPPESLTEPPESLTEPPESLEGAVPTDAAPEGPGAPVAITASEEPEDIFVDIGDPIPVDVDCTGSLVITVDGQHQDGIDQIEPSALGLGDHVIDVVCDGEQITSVRAVVYEQEESAPGGQNMALIVMFVVMAAAAFLFAPSASGRKRVPL